VSTMSQGIAIMSALAVVVGGYIAMLQWARYQMLLRTSRK